MAAVWQQYGFTGGAHDAKLPGRWSYLLCVGSSSHHVVSTSLGGAYTDDRSESSSCPLGALAFGGLPVRFLGVAGAETELPG